MQSPFITKLLAENVFIQLDELNRNSAMADVLINHSTPDDMKRLANCRELLAELFPALDECSAIIAAGAMSQALFKKTD